MHSSIEIRGTLIRIEQLLSEKERQRLHFLLLQDTPRSVCEDYSSSGTLRLLQNLFERELITEENLNYLIEIFRTMDRPDIVNILRKHHVDDTTAILNIATDETEDKVHSMIKGINKTSDFQTTKIIPQAFEKQPNQPVSLNLLAKIQSASIHRSKLKIFNRSLSLTEIILFCLLVITIIAYSISLAIQKNRSEKTAPIVSLADFEKWICSDVTITRPHPNSCFYYYMTNHFTGDNMTLSVDTGNAVLPLRVSKFEDDEAHHWYFVRLTNQTYRIHNRFLKNDYSINAINTTKNDQIFMRQTTASPEQYWRFLQNADGSIRLYNEMKGDTSYLDVYSGYNVPFMGSNEHDYTGQRWEFHPIGRISSFLE